MAAADVGDDRTALKLRDDAVERGQPARDQVRVVARPEEALAALVYVVHVLVPAEAVAFAGRLDDLRRVHDRAEGDLEEPRQVGRALRIGQRERLLRRQRVAAARGLVFDVAARRLGVQPFADVSLGRSGSLGELRGRERPGPGELAVQAELVAHHDERRVQRRPHLVHCPEHELLELGAVDRDRLFDCRHGSLLGRVALRG